MMNLIEFNKILSQPGQIKKDQTQALDGILEDYPYFQAAHFLHLMGLKKQHSFKYNDFLKKTAAYTSDRAILFDYISADNRDLNPAPAPAAEPVPVPDPKSQPFTEAVQPAPEENEIEESPGSEAMSSEATPEEILNIGRPLEFKSDESYSFREWLQLSCFEPIDRQEASGKENQSVPEQKPQPKTTPDKMDLIDKFIAANPKINTSEYDNYADIATDSVQENENLMTETLAHVYVAQKKYKKAMTAFTVLSLKYPEKSSFFATQIEAIKKLQEK